MGLSQTPEKTRWFTRCRPDYDADPMSKYTIMIMAPEDPERRPRPPGGQEDRAPHLTFAKMNVAELRRAIWEHLADWEPRTLNRIGVELWDKTGSIIGGTNVEVALWDLVLAGRVEFTTVAPIYFRRCGQLDLPG